MTKKDVLHCLSALYGVAKFGGIYADNHDIDIDVCRKFIEDYVFGSITYDAAAVLSDVTDAISKAAAAYGEGNSKFNDHIRGALEDLTLALGEVKQ